MSRVHELENQMPQISENGEVLERATSHRFLGLWIQENLKWTDHLTQTVSSRFALIVHLYKHKGNRHIY